MHLRNFIFPFNETKIPERARKKEMSIISKAHCQINLARIF